MASLGWSAVAVGANNSNCPGRWKLAWRNIKIRLDPGDVLIRDERATLHRGRPWPYDQPRTLVSICVTARDADGLAGVRPG